jgi:hypothetical protein
MTWISKTAVGSVLTAMGIVACGGQTNTENTTAFNDAGDAASSPDDATTDGVLDSSTSADEGLADVDADGIDAGSDGWAPECGAGEQRSCNSPFTGCPGSTQQCSGDGTWAACPCATCVLQLDPGVCSWTLESDAVQVPSATAGVHKSDQDGGTILLPDALLESGCTDAGGWYPIPNDVLFAPKVQIVLCPATCEEHQQTPGIAYVLIQNGCPTG